MRIIDWSSDVVSSDLRRLTAQLQSLDQRFVTRVVDSLDVVQKTPTLADHDEKAPSRVEVLLVRLHVLGQVADALGQDRDLHLRGAGIAGLAGKFLAERILALGRNRHRMLLFLERSDELRVGKEGVSTCKWRV